MAITTQAAALVSSTVARMQGIRLKHFTSNSSVITDHSHIWIENSVGSAGTITNATAIRIPDFTSGTNNTAILLGTTTAPAGNWAIYPYK